LTANQVAVLRAIKFEASELPGSYLGEANGNRILVSLDAQGKGWFVDATLKMILSLLAACWLGLVCIPSR
jgi:hypothetical protein